MSWSPIGRPIRVGIFENPPNAFNCFRRLPQKSCPKPGSEVEILSMVMKILDWQWEFVDTEREFNVVNDLGNPLPDGNFTGMMGLLQTDKIDMIGVTMRITQDRMAFAHFTYPILYYQQVYILKRPDENVFRNFIISPFNTEVWLTLLAVLIGGSTMRFICSLCWNSRVGSKFNIYTSTVLESFGQMLAQAVQNPTAISAMILEGFLVISMFNVSQFYQSSMSSRLVAPPSTRIPFLHQDQLIKLLMEKKTFLTYYNDFPPTASTEENEEKLKIALAKNPIIVRDDFRGLFDEMINGGVYFGRYDIDIIPNVVSVWEKGLNLISIRDTTGVLNYIGFAFSNNNKKLCKMFNKALLKTLPGIGTISTGPGNTIKKQAEDITIQVKKTRLSLTKHLEQLFYIFLIGCAISLISFIIENIVFRVNNLKNK